MVLFLTLYFEESKPKVLNSSANGDHSISVAPARLARYLRLASARCCGWVVVSKLNLNPCTLPRICFSVVRHAT